MKLFVLSFNILFCVNTFPKDQLKSYEFPTVQIPGIIIQLIDNDFISLKSIYLIID